MCVGKHAFPSVSQWHNFSLMSQTAQGHRNPISIKCKWKNRFVWLCASIIISHHLSLVHFDTFVPSSFLCFSVIARSACVADSDGVCNEAGGAESADRGEEPLDLTS